MRNRFIMYIYEKISIIRTIFLKNKITKVGEIMAQMTAEQIMEDTLIQQLISGPSQWVYRNDLHTEEELWENFKLKLERNNQDVLGEVPLSEQEFRQIKNQLSFGSFYEASNWLVGENGIAKVQVQRQDATLGTIRLRVINRQDVAGGISSYEVINQFVSSKRVMEDANRRFDVTLLINGLPMIHIELKNRSHSYMDAFRQIKKYVREGKFTGIYSTVQMFVVSNGSDSRYIAAAQDTKLNEQFLTKWVDQENQPVTDYLEFAREVLSIPMAHKMVTQYTVLDNEKRALILLRPYQIHAIEQVKEASKWQKSGFIWHTTGSGKTLTSYKVARNLLQIPSLQKTIFIVDRVDLDQQTTNSFTSYAENDVIEIDETDNVNDLIKKLLSDDRTVVVTTIQKLNFVMKRFVQQEKSKQYEKLVNLKVAFVVDECHRAVSPAKKREIEEFFIYSLWYGFTGTPIFKENAKTVVGDLPRTTAQQYGDCLHEYTVKEAIHDRAVLGFQVEYKSTFAQDDLDCIVAQLESKNELAIADWSIPDKEARLPKNIYLKEEHMLEVVRSIVNKSRNKLGFMKGVGQTYDAILTTSSIAQAQKYFALFQSVKNGESSIVIDKEVKRVLPDFPKVAITYSISENEEASIANQDEMKKAIALYNQEFGTNFTIETMRAYNRNVNDRLARKKEKYLVRSEQLDLVIVVDRLLTGFDAPCLSTLFIDRQPMKPHDLIQAFSRTNRLFDKYKKYGQIVTFQAPKTFEEKVKEALILYSNGGQNEVLAPSWQESATSFSETITELKELVSNPKELNLEGMNQGELKKFIKAFQQFDKAYAAVQVYSEFDMDMMGNEFPFNPKEYEAYRGKYENAIEIIRIDIDPDPDEVEVDIAYELESVNTEEINYEYILMLIQAFVPSGDDEYELLQKEDQKATAEINKYIETLRKNNPKLAEVLQEIWANILENPEAYRDQNVSNVLEDVIQKQETTVIKGFADFWHVDEEEVAYVVSNFNEKNEKQPGENELKKTGNYQAYREANDNPVTKLKYRRSMIQNLNEVVKEEILPFRKR